MHGGGSSTATIRRLRSLQVHLPYDHHHQQQQPATPAATATSARVPAALTSAGGAPKLLSDESVQSFIRDGFLLVPQPELPPSFHADVYERCKAYWTQPERPSGREYFLAIPQLTEVLRTPSTVGALTSLLGPEYVQHPHRTMHTRADEIGGDQDWHKDGHHVPIRHHFPRWIICFYFPMETTLGMGPTAVIPGSTYYTTDKQDATGAEVVGNWGDDRLERILQNPTTDLSGGNLDARDARLQEAISKGLGESFEEKKLLVPAGTLAVLHFDLFHRGTRRIPNHDIRTMFKLQFFRTTAPVAGEPSWDHDPALQDDETFSDGTPDQQVVWRGVWSWMKGVRPFEDTTETAAKAGRLEDTETEALLAQLQNATMDAERMRVGAAYALGRKAADGDRAALKGLLREVAGPTESTRRAAVYGLGAAGDVAVPGLVEELRTATATQGSAAAGTLVPAVAHALGEATRTASSCAAAAQALVSTMENLEQRLIGRMGLFEGVSSGVDRRASKLRFALAASMQALGCVAERVVAASDTEQEQLQLQPLAETICDALLPYTLIAEEPGAESPHGELAGDSHWAREAATHGLLRLSSGGGRGAGTGQVIKHTTPAWHSDDRFLPAFSRLAERRAASVAWLRDKFSAENVQAGWARMSARGMAEAKEEWLRDLSEEEGGSTAGVVWHDREEALAQPEAAQEVAYDED